MKDWKYINGAEVGNDSSFVESAKRHLGENKTKSDAEYWQYIIDKLKKDDPEERAFVEIAKRELAKTKENLSKVGNVNTGNQDGVARMFEGLVKDENKEVEKDSGSIEDLEKVGNLSKNELLETLEAEKKLLKVLEERGGEKGYGTIPSLYRASKRHIQDLEKKLKNIGNKVGNSTYDITERDYENEYKTLVRERNNVQEGSPEYKKIQKRLEEIRKKLGRSPFGNSASDDKFAYVMREFEEGKLKSSSGDIVTNPEQAKAIAYSESKKAENGLSRARMAMKV